MLHLKANNSITEVEFLTTDKSAIKSLNLQLRNILSYEVPSAEWSNKYKTGVWDGRISVYKKQSFPSGLTNYVIEKLTDLNIDFTWSDERNLPWKNAKFSANFGNRKLRYYQEESPLLAEQFTRGIFSLPTASGKTYCICNILAKLQCKPVVIIVPSISLLRQTSGEIESILSENNIPITVGRIGGGFWDVKMNSVNIATYQSALGAYNTKFLESKNTLIYDEYAGETIKKSIPQLEEELKEARKKKNLKAIKKIEDQIITKKTTLNNKQNFQQLLETCQVFIVDECHLACEIIEFLSSRAKNAYYKFGTTATAFRTDNQEIRIEGALGGILINIPSSELIKKGYLNKPTILMFKHESTAQCQGYQDCYTKNIVNSDSRNLLISDLANELHLLGLPTVVLVERLEHGRILENIIKDAVFVPGKGKGEDDPDEEERDYRKQMLNKMGRNEVVLIATQWIYTGVDCPPWQCLILAGSGSSPITTYQQIGRVLRLSPETQKTFALVIDFYDTNKYLKTHGANRKKTYKLEDEFDLRVISK